MGANQSNEVKQLTSVTSKNITNLVNNNTTSASASNTNTNSFTFENEGTIKGCNLKLGQKITANQTVKVQSKITSAADLQNQLKMAVDNTMKQGNTAVNGFLSTAFSNQKSSVDIQNILNSTIENNVTNDNVTQCNAILDNANLGKIINKGTIKCGPNGSINNPQEIISTQMVECYSDALNSALMKNELIAKAVNNVAQDNSSKNAGVAEAITAITSGLMMPFIILFVIILIIGMIMYFMSSGKKQTIKTNFKF